MVRNAICLLSASVIFCSLGCGPAEVKPPPTAPVKGTVTLGGQPMASGEVVFSVSGQPVKQIPVTNGTFAGEANIGKNRVEVNSYKESAATSGLSTDTVLKQNIVADQFAGNSTLTAEVTAAGPNEFKFDVTAK